MVSVACPRPGDGPGYAVLRRRERQRPARRVHRRLGHAGPPPARPRRPVRLTTDGPGRPTRRVYFAEYV